MFGMKYEHFDIKREAKGLNGKQWARRAAFILAICATAALALAFPALRRYATEERRDLPPGARAARRRLVTVWVAGDLPGASAWLRGQAAAYSAGHPGVSVWLRAVSAQDLEHMADAPPDLMIFTADLQVPTGAAVPLCASGYALLVPDQAAATPAPRSLFGVSPTPDPAATPPPAGTAWPARFLMDDGFGALALASMSAPPGGEAVSSGAALTRFLAGEPALLTLAQARAAQAKGAAFRVAAAAAATDLVLYGMVCGENETAADLLACLASAPAQQALAAQGLIPALPGLRLYGPDQPAAQAVEYALADGWRAPAFQWAEQREAACRAAKAMYRAGQDPAGLLDTIGKNR